MDKLEEKMIFNSETEKESGDEKEIKYIQDEQGNKIQNIKWIKEFFMRVSEKDELWYMEIMNYQSKFWIIREDWDKGFTEELKDEYNRIQEFDRMWFSIITKENKKWLILKTSKWIEQITPVDFKKIETSVKNTFPWKLIIKTEKEASEFWALQIKRKRAVEWFTITEIKWSEEEINNVIKKAKEKWHIIKYLKKRFNDTLQQNLI